MTYAVHLARAFQVMQTQRGALHLGVLVSSGVNKAGISSVKW